MHSFQQHYRKWITGSLLVLCTIALGKLNLDTLHALWSEQVNSSIGVSTYWEDPSTSGPSATLAESVFTSVVHFAHTIGKWTISGSRIEQVNETPCRRRQPQQYSPTPTIVPVMYDGEKTPAAAVDM